MNYYGNTEGIPRLPMLSPTSFKMFDNASGGPYPSIGKIMANHEAFMYAPPPADFMAIRDKHQNILGLRVFANPHITVPRDMWDFQGYPWHHIKNMHLEYRQHTSNTGRIQLFFDDITTGNVGTQDGYKTLLNYRIWIHADSTAYNYGARSYEVYKSNNYINTYIGGPMANGDVVYTFDTSGYSYNGVKSGFISWFIEPDLSAGQAISGFNPGMTAVGITGGFAYNHNIAGYSATPDYEQYEYGVLITQAQYEAFEQVGYQAPPPGRTDFFLRKKVSGNTYYYTPGTYDRGVFITKNNVTATTAYLATDYHVPSGRYTVAYLINQTYAAVRKTFDPSNVLIGF